jgi:uncharacterized membrane protein
VRIGFIKTQNPFISTIFGLCFSVLFIYFVGFFVTTFIGKRLFEFGEKLIGKVPFVRGLYSAAKKLTDSIFSKKTAFKKVVLIQFPQQNHYAIAFVTTDKKWELDGKKYVNVFVPTTPNPTSGWYLVVPEEEIYEVDFTVEEGLKALISAGIVLPESKDAYKVFKESIRYFQKKK